MERNSEFDLSIIVTTFRRPVMLQRALLSIAAQRFEGCQVKLQLIVSDDADDSGARTIDVLSRVGAAPEVECIYIKRATAGVSGVAASRNRALHMACGEWILFLDDDDELDPSAVQNLVSVSRKTEGHFIYGNFVVFDDSSNGDGSIIEAGARVGVSYNHLLLSNYFPIGSYAIRRSAIVHPFDPSMKTHEDWLFLLDNLSAAVLVSAGCQFVRISRRGEGCDHRTNIGGVIQKLRDYQIVYRRHPAPSLTVLRYKILLGIAANGLD